ncbi:MAG: hypothetical protein BGO49_21500 [Planctomycetales bacterium 71-10]|nr:MAG: hypothetical protein BGO49_21500 [Planctomycetales bacterium 71-10]
MLTREAFLQAREPRRELVAVPEFGEGATAYVRQITAGERDEFEASMQRKRGKDIRVRLVILATCDAEGRRIFTDDDVPSLRELPAAALEPIVNAYLRMNGSNPAEMAKLAEE